jgi:hypothetical protein
VVDVCKIGFSFFQLCIVGFLSSIKGLQSTHWWHFLCVQHSCIV